MTCAKQTVTATLVTSLGEKFIGTNWCEKPQDKCPRDGMPTGVGYELCKSVCKQTNHAEVNAVIAAGEKAKGSVIYLDGHYYACNQCQKFARDAGVLDIVLVATVI